MNALIDAVENAVPETVMEEAIREVDGAIDEVRAELGRVVANKHLANSRLMEENRKHESLAEKIELAVSEGRDDLAEAAISQQLDIEAQIPVLEATIAECGSEEKELESYVRALQAKKREMQDELRQYRDSRKTAGTVGAGGEAGAGASGATVEAKVEKAGSAFDRALEKAAGMPARARGTDRETSEKLSELEELQRKNRVQERLAAIKGKSHRAD